MLHELIVNGWQDQEFLDKYCVGFDADHMPADALTDESFMDYLMGKSDGIPKTQQWASEICGTPVELITELASVCGKNNKTGKSTRMKKLKTTKKTSLQDRPQ